MTNECIFCKIIKGDIPSNKIYEDDYAFAFLDINPSTEGHTLVIPKKHYKNISDIPTEDLSKFMKSLQKVAKGLLKFGNGLNILQNNGETAGQIVFHMHFHLIPRREGDGVSIGHWESKKNLDIDKIQENIKSLLNQ
ncbi:MAG: HIT family protein [Nanoarchaeota archaeon]|nr:HIT family protein [Nanoarchaeota archaeon]